jgi:hypothetical protein
MNLRDRSDPQRLLHVQNAALRDAGLAQSIDYSPAWTALGPSGRDPLPGLEPAPVELHTCVTPADFAALPATGVWQAALGELSLHAQAAVDVSDFARFHPLLAPRQASDPLPSSDSSLPHKEAWDSSGPPAPMPAGRLGGRHAELPPPPLSAANPAKLAAAAKAEQLKQVIVSVCV